MNGTSSKFKSVVLRRTSHRSKSICRKLGTEEILLSSKRKPYSLTTKDKGLEFAKT